MEPWFIVLVSLSICIAFKSLFNLFQQQTTKLNKLPPGPPSLPILGNLLSFPRSIFDVEPTLQRLIPKYGPIITLHYFSRPVIFITNHALAYQALIQNGAIFADRPPAPRTGSSELNISSTMYGPLWRLLRRNLASEILHPSRVKSFGDARKGVLSILINKLKTQAESGEPIRVIDQFHYAMFCLLVFMCFGKKVDEKAVREIEAIIRRELLSFRRFSILNFFPKLGKIVFRKRWNELLEMKRIQKSILSPLVRSRQEQKEKAKEEDFVVAYVDSLLDLQIPDQGRNLNEDEILSLCVEFLVGGTDTTSTALQWIMANLVKHQEIQAKLILEIEGVVKFGEEIREEDLQNMPYLKAVILEGLRLYPPGHFVLPHAVTDAISLEGHLIPKNALVNFMVAEMGRDAKVWEDPMAFKPERFMGSEREGEFDITGSREIKMMPFGAGRRICPGFGLAMLHLEYFVANLVKEFKWTARKGDVVDLTEEAEFTIVMKFPLQAHVSPRET